ncbi:MAG: SH3 domain-containing protein [Atopobiaceae bacterium]|nr:SH3 domain-containing protein [Atopobiaceae bacterium]
MNRHVSRKGMRWLVVVIALLVAMVPANALAKGGSQSTYSVRVDKGYLALRTAPAYDEANEIGELYTGDVVRVKDKSNGKYWWVYSPKYDREGYVNKNYLVRVDTSVKRDYRVTVAKGYLALRTAPAYDEANEIGELYTGDIVSLIERYNDTYWWVYSSKYGTCGYVNRKYLSGTTPSTYEKYKVRVARGYLALRTAPAYDEANEIGELYTGDVVTVKDRSNRQYWWVYSSKYGKSGYVNKDYLVKL